MSIQEDLDELGYIRTRLSKQPVEAFALQFQQALILKRKNNELSIWTLRTPEDNGVRINGSAPALLCPRDNENAWVVYQNEVRQGFEVCSICKNCLTCMVTGTTKSFQLIQQGDEL